jgi:hypothetical protein
MTPPENSTVPGYSVRVVRSTIRPETRCTFIGALQDKPDWRCVAIAPWREKDARGGQEAAREV